MQFQVTFRNVEASDAIKTYARERLEKIKKYFPDPIAVNVVLSTERYNHKVDVNLQLHNGFQIAGHEATENMYSSIDMVAAKIERQVRRYKGKLTQHKKKTGFEPLPIRHSVLQEAERKAAAQAEEQQADDGPVVVKIKAEYHAAPLTPDEAVMQLNLLHKQFLVFRDATSGSVSVVYRREDDTYGLIETPGQV